MAQEVEHFLGKEEVTGSNPVSSSKNKSLALSKAFVVRNPFEKWYLTELLEFASSLKLL